MLSGRGVNINLAGGASSRLIVGDCSTSIGNPVDQHTIGYIHPLSAGHGGIPGAGAGLVGSLGWFP